MQTVKNVNWLTVIQTLLILKTMKVLQEQILQLVFRTAYFIFSRDSSSLDTGQQNCVLGVSLPPSPPSPSLHTNTMAINVAYTSGTTDNISRYCTTAQNYNLLDSALNWTELHCHVLPYVALYYIGIHCTVLHWLALHYTALHCTALKYTAMHCTEPH